MDHLAPESLASTSSTGSPSGSQPHARRRPGLKRTKNGCHACRLKHRKCDEIRPKCTRCSKAGRECLWSTEVFRPYVESSPVQSSAQPLEVFPVASFNPTPPSLATIPTSSASPPTLSLPRVSISSTALTVRSQTQHEGGEWHLPPEIEALFYSQPTSMLHLTYPDPEERALLQHYFSFVPHFPAALSPEEASRDLEVALPSLQATQFLSLPRGYSLASDALSLALLSCASVHLAWLHRSHALDNILAGRTDLAAVSLDQHTRYFATSVSLVAAALSMSRAAFLMEGSAQAATLNAEEHDARLDYIREAVEHCILVHCLSGGRGFRATMDFLHDLRRSKGGPRDVLEAARESGDKKKLRRVRVAMENAASWEVWSAFSTGRSPEVFNEPIDSWFFDPSFTSAYPKYATPGVNEDWETFDAITGLGRPVFRFLLVFTTIYASARGPKALSSARLEPVAEPWLSKSWALTFELEACRAWLLEDPDNVATPFARVIYIRNLIWIAALEILVDRDLLARTPPATSMTRSILSLFDTCAALPGGLVMGLTWPLLIASAECADPTDRARFKKGFELMRFKFCCFNLDTAMAVLDKIWTLRDAGNTNATWRDVIDHFGEEVEEGLLLF